MSIARIVVLVVASVLAPTSAFAPVSARPGVVTVPRSALVQRNQPATCIAKTAEDKALLASSKKVVMIAKRFGVAQGKGAQAWVEQAVKGGDARTESLISMQLALFEECTLDDEVRHHRSPPLSLPPSPPPPSLSQPRLPPPQPPPSQPPPPSQSGKCKQLTAAMEDMVSAVEKRSSSSFFKEGVLKPSSLSLQFGPTAVQTAANKLRNAASKFGPEQKVRRIGREAAAWDWARECRLVSPHLCVP